jgi:hypothetical protein
LCIVFHIMSLLLFCKIVYLISFILCCSIHLGWKMRKFHVNWSIILLLSKRMALWKPLLSQDVLLISPSDHFVLWFPKWNYQWSKRSCVYYEAFFFNGYYFFTNNSYKGEWPWTCEYIEVKPIESICNLSSSLKSFAKSYHKIIHITLWHFTNLRSKNVVWWNTH